MRTITCDWCGRTPLPDGPLAAYYHLTLDPAYAMGSIDDEVCPGCAALITSLRDEIRNGAKEPA